MAHVSGITAIFMYLFDFYLIFFKKLGIKAQETAETDTAHPRFSGILFIALQSASLMLRARQSLTGNNAERAFNLLTIIHLHPESVYLHTQVILLLFENLHHTSSSNTHTHTHTSITTQCPTGKNPINPTSDLLSFCSASLVSLMYLLV